MIRYKQVFFTRLPRRLYFLLDIEAITWFAENIGKHTNEPAYIGYVGEQKGHGANRT